MLNIYCLVALFITFEALSDSAYGVSLRNTLKNTPATIKLFNDFKKRENLKYDREQNKKRFGLFKENAEFVRDANEKEDDTSTYGINSFSVMTPLEANQYSGLNRTLTKRTNSKLLKRENHPDVWYSTDLKLVTPIKNQIIQECHASWAFTAIGVLETRYKMDRKQMDLSTLRNFAEQELIDCAVDEGIDGCHASGLNTNNAYDYIIRTNRIAATEDYLYKFRKGICKQPETALISAFIKEYQHIFTDQPAENEVLYKKFIWSHGAIDVSIHATKYFWQYSGGLFKDKTCEYKDPKVSLVAIGYTTNYFLVKNSWGTGWGDQGFAKIGRDNLCGLTNYGIAVIMHKVKGHTWTDISPNDPATDYNPIMTPGEGETANCDWKKCNRWGCYVAQRKSLSEYDPK